MDEMDKQERLMTLAARTNLVSALQAAGFTDAREQFADTIRVTLPGGIDAKIKIELKGYPATLQDYAGKMLEQMGIG